MPGSVRFLDGRSRSQAEPYNGLGRILWDDAHNCLCSLNMTSAVNVLRTSVKVPLPSHDHPLPRGRSPSGCPRRPPSRRILVGHSICVSHSAGKASSGHISVLLFMMS